MNRIKLPLLPQVVPPHWRALLGRGMHQLRLGLLPLVGFRAKKPQRSSTFDISISLAAAGIRLAGATNDVHIFDVRSGKWEKITPQGEPPSPRAAHAAAAVGNMVVIQVGCIPSKDLHVSTIQPHVLMLGGDRPGWVGHRRSARP